MLTPDPRTRVRMAGFNPSAPSAGNEPHGLAGCPPRQGVSESKGRETAVLLRCVSFLQKGDGCPLGFPRKEDMTQTAFCSPVTKQKSTRDGSHTSVPEAARRAARSWPCCWWPPAARAAPGRGWRWRCRCPAPRRKRGGGENDDAGARGENAAAGNGRVRFFQGGCENERLVLGVSL